MNWFLLWSKIKKVEPVLLDLDELGITTEIMRQISEGSPNAFIDVPFASLWDRFKINTPVRMKMTMPYGDGNLVFNFEPTCVADNGGYKSLGATLLLFVGGGNFMQIILQLGQATMNNADKTDATVVTVKTTIV